MAVQRLLKRGAPFCGFQLCRLSQSMLVKGSLRTCELMTSEVHVFEEVDNHSEVYGCNSFGILSEQ